MDQSLFITSTHSCLTTSRATALAIAGGYDMCNKFQKLGSQTINLISYPLIRSCLDVIPGGGGLFPDFCMRVCHFGQRTVRPLHFELGYVINAPTP